jgi:8-oxo-dGTP pyrophosphatase MutT (NUDIX family)
MRRGAGLLIIADDTGRALVAKRCAHGTYGGHWAGFGGGAEPEDLTMMDTALRELEEETGYNGPLDLYECIGTPSGHSFLAFVPEEFVPELNWEHDNWEWVELEDIDSMCPLHPAVVRMLESDAFWEMLC